MPRLPIILVAAACMLLATSCGPAQPGNQQPTEAATAADWVQAFPGNDTPPGFFRDIRMGDSPEKVKVTPGLKVLSQDDGFLLMEVQPVGNVHGKASFLFTDGKLTQANIALTAEAAPADLGKLYEFLKERYLDHYGTSSTNEGYLMHWTDLSAKGMGSVTLQWLDLNEELDITFEAA